MDPNVLRRMYRQGAIPLGTTSPRQETDWANRTIPRPDEIAAIIHGKNTATPSRRELRRIEKMERRSGGNPERG